MTDHAVDLGREILRVSRPFLTKSAPSVTYNEFTYQSEGSIGGRGLFVCIRKCT